MYTAADSDELWDDEGTLHAFVADGTPTRTTTTSTSSPARRSTGNFLPVPEDIAKGKAARRPRADASGRLPELPGAVRRAVGAAGRAAVDARPVGRTPRNTPTSVTSRQRQRRLRLHPHRGHRIRQATGMSNVVYIADSGRATAGAADPLTTSTNGRIYKMVLDPNGTGDPTEAEISILVQGDDSPNGRPGTRVSGVAQRDPPAGQPRDDRRTATCSSPRTRARRNQYACRQTRTRPPARLWKVPLGQPTPTPRRCRCSR